MGGLTRPASLSAYHILDEFDCGIPAMNDWLRRRALPNESSGASRSFVVCQGAMVVGFYALATGAVRRENAPGMIRRAMPEPIPVMVLGRLAVDLNWQKQGIGTGLLKDALLRTLTVSKQAGIRALVVHALSEDAKHFYLLHGFKESPLQPMTLMLSLAAWKL
jgi:GNAT superfamily N-acetyltransferase